MQRITPTTPAVNLQNVRDLTGAERKKKKQAIDLFQQHWKHRSLFPSKIF
jgi:hypothetical protein